jgi:hypothetical protein
MSKPHIVIVTGASGVGKTTLVRALAERGLAGVHCHHFDSVGVPPQSEMEAQDGSGRAWQWATLQTWIARLAVPDPHVRVAVLDAQVRPSDVRAALALAGVPGTIVHIECAASVREARLLGARQQPALVNSAMAMWAAYLRGQADALGLAVLDTSEATLVDSASALEHLVLAVG